MANAAQDYRSWSFTDRSFLFGLAVSVLWHLFWFFSVTIVVTPPKVKKPVRSEMVSLGPVLDDALIRTLVESRPEYSKAFYRELSDFDAATQVPERTLERYESGDVNSLPVGGETAGTLRRLMSGTKASSEEFFHGATGFSASDYFFLQGDLSADQVLSRPDPPPVNDVRSVEIEFEVDNTGKVAESQVSLSSGDAALDAKWEDHLRQWLFSPSPILGQTERAKGKAVFRRSTVN